MEKSPRPGKTGPRSCRPAKVAWVLRDEGRIIYLDKDGDRIEP